MSATSDEKTTFRYEFDGDETTMPDAWIDALFNTAESDYAGEDRRVQVQAAYLNASRQLRNRAAKQVDYQQNNAQEKLGQLRAHWDSVVKDYERQLALTLADTKGAPLRIGRGKAVPTRRKEYPDS